MTRGSSSRSARRCWRVPLGRCTCSAGFLILTGIKLLGTGSQPPHPEKNPVLRAVAALRPRHPRLRRGQVLRSAATAIMCHAAVLGAGRGRGDRRGLCGRLHPRGVRRHPATCSSSTRPTSSPSWGCARCRFMVAGLVRRLRYLNGAGAGVGLRRRQDVDRRESRSRLAVADRGGRPRSSAPRRCRSSSRARSRPTPNHTPRPGRRQEPSDRPAAASQPAVGEAGQVRRAPCPGSRSRGRRWRTFVVAAFGDDRAPGIDDQRVAIAAAGRRRGCRTARAPARTPGSRSHALASNTCQ